MQPIQRKQPWMDLGRKLPSNVAECPFCGRVFAEDCHSWVNRQECPHCHASECDMTEVFGYAPEVY